MYGQKTSVMSLQVKSPDLNVYIYDRSTISVIKLQQDYKTPGFVAEVQSQTLTWSNNATINLDEWKTENSKGLAVK